MFLKKHVVTKNGKQYQYYRIVASYTDEQGKKKHRLIKHLGALSDAEAVLDRDTLLFVRDGRGELSMNGRQLALLPGTVLFCPAGTGMHLLNSGDTALLLDCLTFETVTPVDFAADNGTYERVPARFFSAGVIPLAFPQHVLQLCKELQHAAKSRKEISLEALPTYANTDYIFLSTSRETNDAQRKALIDSPLWKSLSAVKNGHLINLDFKTYFYFDPVTTVGQIATLTETLQKTKQSQ